MSSQPALIRPPGMYRQNAPGHQSIIDTKNNSYQAASLQNILQCGLHSSQCLTTFFIQGENLHCKIPEGNTPVTTGTAAAQIIHLQQLQPVCQKPDILSNLICNLHIVDDRESKFRPCRYTLNLAGRSSCRYPVNLIFKF